MPFVDNSDPLNLSVGNPNLKPEFTNSFELNYNYAYKKAPTCSYQHIINTQQISLLIMFTAYPIRYFSLQIRQRLPYHLCKCRKQCGLWL